MAARNIPQNEPVGRTGNPLPVWGKAIISALIAAHIAAITSTPFAFACNRGASPIAEAFRNFFLPYTSALYLAHGYAFFAPDPGPNHLVDYTVEFDDGRPAQKGRFPDLKTERPRLLYHRYFMLSEALHNRFAPPQFDREPTPPALTSSAGERERFAVIKKEYEDAKTAGTKIAAGMKRCGSRLKTISSALTAPTARRSHASSIGRRIRTRSSTSAVR